MGTNEGEMNGIAGFLPKKQQEKQKKPVWEDAPPKMRHDDYVHVSMDRDDPHGRSDYFISCFLVVIVKKDSRS